MKSIDAGHSKNSWKGSACGATTRIVAAYVSGNALKQDKLPDLLNIVHDALMTIAHRPTNNDFNAEKSMHIQILDSVRQDSLISFLDGRSYKTLKRHLAAHGLTPKSYRSRFGLPADYPMVAPDYAAKRSEIAKSLQLGLKS